MRRLITGQGLDNSGWNILTDRIQILDDEGDVLKTYKVPEGRQQFEGVQWEGEDLSGAQLSGANFKGAELYWTLFFMANLDGANFEDAGLQ